jgi:hypothetical protein
MDLNIMKLHHNTELRQQLLDRPERLSDQDYRTRWLVQKYSLPTSLARTIAALAGFNGEGR